MITVGIKNLRDSLSKYINIAKSGEKVLITDHNRVVAEIIPSSAQGASSDLLKEYIEEQTTHGTMIEASENSRIEEAKQTAEYDKSLAEGIYRDSRKERI